MTDEKVLAALVRAMDKAAADFSSYDWDWFQDERVAPAILAALHDAGWTLVRQEGLDAAWAEAEAALPEGWSGPSVAQNWKGRWYAYAYQHHEDAPSNPSLPRHVDAEDHSTPAEALRALARVLRGDDQ